MAYVIYVVAALLVGWLGRNRQIGFVGFFVISLLVTPVLTLIVLMVTHTRQPQLPS